MTVDTEFRERCWEPEPLRSDDERDDYQRDKARIIHSAAFRRLQAKTQIMGVGEGDFHRTRLTHSIETAQIGEGLLNCLKRNPSPGEEICDWLPSLDLIAAACYAHDLGHPPFGHGGERALYKQMVDHGGFEGNGQTLRILTRLEKYRPRQGMNPTRRLLLAVLKYPAAYSTFCLANYRDKPPKCYFDSESSIIDWCLSKFDPEEASIFTTERNEKDRPKHHTLDCSLMECADDIAYGVHDLEDIVARHLVRKDEFIEKLCPVFEGHGSTIGTAEKGVSLTDFDDLFGESHTRKAVVGKLVNLFVTSAKIIREEKFSHPLLRYRVAFDAPIKGLLKSLKKLANDLVVKRAEVQQLEVRGQRIVEKLFRDLVKDPQRLIPESAWKALNEEDSVERRVCDYVAGMTDPYAERIYGRLFTPGFGSSRDEL